MTPSLNQNNQDILKWIMMNHYYHYAFNKIQ